jgi:hypothetical protein
VDNNFIHDGSHMFRGAHGVWIGRSSHNTVTHNEISNFDYSGISCGWSWGFQPSSANHNILDFNYIHHLGNGDGLGDMGAIYTLGVSPGTTVRNNHIHDVYNYAHVSHGSGIYPDEGSTGILIENNVVYRVRNSPLFMHYGMECIVRNNISRWATRANCAARAKTCAATTSPKGTSSTAAKTRGCSTVRGRTGTGSSDATCTGARAASRLSRAWTSPPGRCMARTRGPSSPTRASSIPTNGDFRLRPIRPRWPWASSPSTSSGRACTAIRSGSSCRRVSEPAAQRDPAAGRSAAGHHFDFEADEPMPNRSTARIVKGENGASVLVSADASSGGTRSLKFTDAPDQRYGGRRTFTTTHLRRRAR